MQKPDQFSEDGGMVISFLLPFIVVGASLFLLFLAVV